MTAADIVRSSRIAQKISQTELAIQSQIAGSSISLIEHGKREPTFATMEKLLRVTGHSIVTIPTVRSDANRIAARIRSAITAHDHAAAFRHFLQLADNLHAETGATRVGLTLAEPIPTGSAPWDTAIAALCEYRLNSDGLPLPEWIPQRAGTPERPWEPRTSDYHIPVEIINIPPEFLRRGILIEAATLQSV